MNGDLIQTNVLIGDKEEAGNENGIVVGDFYALMPKLDYAKNFDVIVDNGLI